jgi:adenosylcobyric acid synthase
MGTTAGTRGALLVCGATSGAGKSTVAAALCRLLARDGAAVAPFKAQNMSNHSAVTADGGEVGRAQAMQAAAAGIDVETVMNPILLKPSSERGSHVVVCGREVGATDAVGWGQRTESLRPVVLAALESLRERFDVVVAEGAGGAAEINLLGRDLVNLPLAHAAGMRALLVVDIEPGGAFAAAHGTIDLLPPALRPTVGAIVFNRFRGDPSLLGPGIDELRARSGVPVIGVLPHLGGDGLLGVEDSLDVGRDQPAVGSTEPLRVAVVRLPRLANPSDLDPLAVEPDVELRWVTGPGQIADADLVVLPGSRATVADLRWLRETGLADALAQTDADVIGICAGLQMLGRRIVDTVESGAGAVDGLGLLPTETTFTTPKVVRRRRGTVGGQPVAGYQIHLGRVAAAGDGWLQLDDDHGGAGPDGAVGRSGRVRGTTLHGLFDADGARAAILTDIAERRGRRFRPAPVPFAERLATQHDRLADWLADHVDIPAVTDLVGQAAAPGTGPGWWREDR